MTETEAEMEMKTMTKKDWILFMLVIAFFVFLAIATFVILTDTKGMCIPQGSPGPWH